jgi:hypothetical protein
LWESHDSWEFRQQARSDATTEVRDDVRLSSLHSWPASAARASDVLLRHGLPLQPHSFERLGAVVVLDEAHSLAVAQGADMGQFHFDRQPAP